MTDSTRKQFLGAVHTDGYVHVPQLRRKLKLLYGYHRPLVDTQYKLAGVLGVSPATLATWLNGTRHEDARTIAPLNPDSIRASYYPQFVDIWGLPRATLELEDLAAFSAALATFQAGLTAWDKLVRAVNEDESIEIVVSRTRGLIDPDDEDDPSILRFDPQDEILIRVASGGFRHGLMLLQDRFGWSCLRPNARRKETEIGDLLVFPHQSPGNSPRFARLDEVGGVHRVLAILAMEPFPNFVGDVLLSKPLDPGGLNTIALHFQTRLGVGTGKCRMLCRRFMVGR